MRKVINMLNLASLWWSFGRESVSSHPSVRTYVRLAGTPYARQEPLVDEIALEAFASVGIGLIDYCLHIHKGSISPKSRQPNCQASSRERRNEEPKKREKVNDSIACCL
jgi:hypothetical protein